MPNQFPFEHVNSVEQFISTANGKRHIPAASNKEFAERVGLAFKDGHAGDLPIAIQPTYVHERLRAQKASFTIHGKDTRNFEELFVVAPLVQKGFFRKYIFPTSEVENILDDLKMLGITHTTIFPDLDGLAKELDITF